MSIFKNDNKLYFTYCFLCIHALVLVVVLDVIFRYRSLYRYSILLPMELDDEPLPNDIETFHLKVQPTNEIPKKSLTYFQPTVPFLYPLKKSENLWFSDVFRGYRTHCKFQILQGTNFLTEILEMRHFLLIMRKKNRNHAKCFLF